MEVKLNMGFVGNVDVRSTDATEASRLDFLGFFVLYCYFLKRSFVFVRDYISGIYYIEA